MFSTWTTLLHNRTWLIHLMYLGITHAVVPYRPCVVLHVFTPRKPHTCTVLQFWHNIDIWQLFNRDIHVAILKCLNLLKIPPPPPPPTHTHIPRARPTDSPNIFAVVRYFKKSSRKTPKYLYFATTSTLGVPKRYRYLVRYFRLLLKCIPLLVYICMNVTSKREQIYSDIKTDHTSVITWHSW